MKAKVLFVVGGAVLLLAMFIIELVPMGYVIWVTVLRDYKPTGEPADLSGLPYFLGALAVIAFIFWISRNDTPTGSPIDMTPQVIHLGYDRHDRDDVIMYAAAKAESRSMGRQTGAPIVLVTPPGFKPEKLDYDAELNYQWLLDHPNFGVTIKK